MVVEIPRDIKINCDMNISSLHDAADQVLDCTRPRNFAFWFLSGTIVVFAAQAVYVTANGGNWAYLIRVGEQANLRPRITAELGEIKATDPLGHDGQMCYVIARDPWDQRGTSEMLRHVDPQYRYRRIAYPLLSGGFGLFSPRATLMGLIVWLAVGAGLSTVALADIAFQRRLPGSVVLLGMINPGILLSAVALTPDSLASGFGMAAIALWLRGRTKGVILCLALATLTKETHFLFAIGIALIAWGQNDRRSAVKVLALPLTCFAVWALWCRMNVANGSSPMHNFTFPGAGIWSAAQQWLNADETALDLMLDFGLGTLGVIMILVIGAAAIRSGNRVVSACGLLWALVALTTSISVWGEPTNLIRVAAPLWPLAWLNGAEAASKKISEPTALPV